MSHTPEQRDEHFETYAEDVGDILRSLTQRWGSHEQLDDEDDPTDQRRCAMGYAYPSDESDGHVFVAFWYGGTADIVVADEGRNVDVRLPAGAYPLPRIRVDLLAEHMASDFLIDDEHTVHSPGELKDRLHVMFNNDHWGLVADSVEENAAIYRDYAKAEVLYRASMVPVAKTLQKMGESWGGEEQTDNTPDPDGNRGGGLFGGGGKKRFFVGYRAPAFRKNERGEAKATPAGVWLDLWQGKKGNVKKGKTARMVELSDKPTAKISVSFAPDGSTMQVDGIPKARAVTADDMRKILTQLWKQDAFKVRK
ncbi:MAG: hypothetical protein AAF787_13400 [Chloroflexota bacterium]